MSAAELRAGGIGGRPGEGMCAVWDGSSERDAGALLVLLLLVLLLPLCGGEYGGMVSVVETVV